MVEIITEAMDKQNAEIEREYQKLVRKIAGAATALEVIGMQDMGLVTHSLAGVFHRITDDLRRFSDTLAGSPAAPDSSPAAPSGLSEAAEALMLAAATILDCDEAGDAEAQSTEWSDATQGLADATDAVRAALKSPAAPSRTVTVWTLMTEGDGAPDVFATLQEAADNARGIMSDIVGGSEELSQRAFADPPDIEAIEECWQARFDGACWITEHEVEIPAGG